MADNDVQEAYLGCATTRELLTEIKARAEIAVLLGDYVEEMQAVAIGAANLLDSLPGSVLGYRTIDGG